MKSIKKVPRLSKTNKEASIGSPAHEVVFFSNKKAMESVFKGLAQARSGKLIKSKKDFSKHLKDNK